MGCVTGKDDDYHEYRTPPIQWQQSRTINPDEFKTTSVTSNGCNRPPDTRELATAPLNASIHGGNLESPENNWRTRRVTDIDDDDHEFRTWSNERNHHPKHLQWTERPYPWMPQYRKPKAESRDNFRVSTVTTTIHLFDRSAPVPVCVYTYTYSSSNLEEAHLGRHDTTTYTWYTTRAKNTYGRGSVYDWRTVTAMNVWTSNCTYEEDTLRLKDIEDETFSLDWGVTLRRVKCIYGQRPTQFGTPSKTTMTTTMTVMTSEDKDYGQLRRQSTNQAPTILHHSATNNLVAVPALMVTMDENQMARCNAYRLLSTAAHPASLWHRGVSSDSGYQAAHIITLAMTGGVMQHAKDSRKTWITV